MAGKRRATSDLNRDNWEQEEEPEDAGTFKRASQDELNRRIIKTAKRRKPILSEDSNKKSAFANFTALSKVSAPSTTAFSFLSKLSGDVTSEETKERKKLPENGSNEANQCENNINDNKSLESSNNGMSDKYSANDNNFGETHDINNRISKEIIENSSHRADKITNNENIGDADEIVENATNKTDELEEFTNKKNIDGDTVVSQDSIVSEDKKGNEVLSDSSEKKDTNNP